MVTPKRGFDIFDFPRGMLHGARTMTAEEERTRLIGDIARVLREGPVPDEARTAALTFIGWLARRMPGEPVSHCDVRRCTGVTPRHDGDFAPKPRHDAGFAPKSRVTMGGTPMPPVMGYEGPPSGPQPRGDFADT